MDKEASISTPKERTNVTKGLAAKYGARWLQPAKKGFGKKTNASAELFRSLPLDDSKKEARDRQISSECIKRSWPPVLKSSTSMDERLPPDTDGKVSASTEEEMSPRRSNKSDRKSARNSKFFDLFQGPRPYRTVGTVRNVKSASPHPRTKHSLHESPKASGCRSSLYSNFNIPQPYVKPKLSNRTIGAGMTLEDGKQQGTDSFYDSKSITNQKSPGHKIVDKISRQGIDGEAAGLSSLELESTSDKFSGSEGICSALKCGSLDNDCPRRSFAHYDWQSVTFSFADVLIAAETLKRKNEATGASKAAAMTVKMNSNEKTPVGSYEDLNKLVSTGEVRTNDMLEWCPFFVNEIGGETDEELIFDGATGQSTTSQTPALSVHLFSSENSPRSVSSSSTSARMQLVNSKGVSVVEKIGIGDDQQLNAVGFIHEYLDNGALYYRKHFFEQDHQNFFGIDDGYGPIAVSIKREKLRESNSNVRENTWNYRVIVRASELSTLRGSVLEDVLLSQPCVTTRILKPRDVLEYTCPEVNFDCLKSAQLSEAVQKQLMKIDEQNIAGNCKIGIMYCKKGQTTEDEMYNNEFGSRGFEEFLDFLADKIQLKGFDQFRGGLDIKSNSTGEESYFTMFQGKEIMFHVSTLLPYTANNTQQVLRKCHIGNDIVTIVFQEPDSPPFSAHNIRSQFQHLFVVVRVHRPCTAGTCYRISVTRAQDIPPFGPLIPKDTYFPKSETFREFLLTKLLNGERAARSAGKFKAMAMNTRQEYLRDLAINHTSPAGLDASPRFARFSFAAASRRVIDRDKPKSKLSPEESSLGALVWHDVTTGGINCVLGISDCTFFLICKSTKRIIFSIPCHAIIGWTELVGGALHVYYGRGERLELRAQSCASCDWRKEVKARLQIFSIGCETKTMTLRRNIRGQLGFHINYEGIVMDVEVDGHAADVGLSQGSRLVEICKVHVVTMTHAEVLDLLRTSDVVTAIVILPLDDGTPRRCSKSLYHVSPVLKMVEIGSSQSEKFGASGGEENGLPLHSHSDVVSGSKHSESVEDITQALAHRVISMKLSSYGSKNFNQNCSVLNSTASTPTAKFNPFSSGRKVRQSGSLDPAVPPGFRVPLESRDFGDGSSRTNWFPVTPPKKHKEKSLVVRDDGMKCSTLTEGGLNQEKRAVKEMTTSRKGTANGDICPNQFSSTPAIYNGVKPQILRPKPFRPARGDPVVLSAPFHNYATRGWFARQPPILYGVPTENGHNYRASGDEVDGGRAASIRGYKDHDQRSWPYSGTRVPKSEQSVMPNHSKCFASPQIERKKTENSVHRKLMRTMSDESIYSISHDQSCRNGDKGDLQDQDFADTTLTNFANSWDRSAFRPINSVQDSRAISASPEREDVYLSCTSDYTLDEDNGSDGGRPRSAASISPILSGRRCSEDDQERLLGFSTGADADARLRNIELTLRSLQSQLAREQRSKRRILKEVEKLRKDNQRLQRGEETRRHRIDMTYA